MKELVIATGNAGKVREIAALLEGVDISLRSLDSYPDLPEIIENGESFRDNAFIKARAVSAHTGLPALADDSGLVVDALDGAPGVHSARFAPTTEERNARLLSLMEDVPDDRRSARFVCALAFVRPDGFEWDCSGSCEGMITRSPEGGGGFGYDPVFYYPPSGKSFAALSAEEKNRASHRGQALRLFARAVRNENLLA